MKAIFVQGMAFGDESKGATVDFLCRELPVDMIVRFNGGPQTAHNVVTPDGKHHTFSQFGSGMLARPTIMVHLSKYMLIDPVSMRREAIALKKMGVNAFERTTIHPECVVITPIHKALNQMRETVRKCIGDKVHGSCGQGVGVARELHLKYGDKVFLAKDLNKYADVYEKLSFLWKVTAEERTKLKEILAKHSISVDLHRSIDSMAEDYVYFPGIVVPILDYLGKYGTEKELILFEGAQGVLLDEKHGFQPHTTWTNCTFENAYELCREMGIKDITKIGCFRSYFTRHGAGPFPSEDKYLAESMTEPHNHTGTFQGNFRVGWFDGELAKKAIDIVGGVDFISVSHLDCYSGPLEYFEQFAPIGIRAWGPTAKERAIDKKVLDRIKESVVMC